MVNLRLRVAHSREQSHDYRGLESVDLLWQASIERSPLYFQEDSRTSTSFPFLQAGPTSNLRVFGDKSIGVSFIQIAQTVHELLTCFDLPTQRGQTIVVLKLETCYVCLTLINHNVYTQSTNSLWNEEIYTMCTCTSTKCGGVLEVLSFAWAARLKWKLERHVKQVHIL